MPGFTGFPPERSRQRRMFTLSAELRTGACRNGTAEQIMDNSLTVRRTAEIRERITQQRYRVENDICCPGTHPAAARRPGSFAAQKFGRNGDSRQVMGKLLLRRQLLRDGKRQFRLRRRKYLLLRMDFRCEIKCSTEKLQGEKQYSTQKYAEIFQSLFHQGYFTSFPGLSTAKTR